MRVKRAFETTFTLIKTILDSAPGFSNVNRPNKQEILQMIKGVKFVLMRWQNFGNFGRSFEDSFHVVLRITLLIRL